MTPIQAGTLWPIEILITDGSGLRITGLSLGSLVVDIRCTTPGGAQDGYFWDFTDGTFKASGWTTRRANLAEVDSVNAAGVYAITAGWNRH